MARTREETMRDIDEMQDAYNRYRNVPYPGSYHEDRYKQARDRVFHDLGDGAKVFETVFPDPDELINTLRNYFGGNGNEPLIPLP